MTPPDFQSYKKMTAASIDSSALETGTAPTKTDKSDQGDEQATGIQDTLAIIENMRTSGTLEAGVSRVIHDHHNPQSAISQNSKQLDRHRLSFQTLQEALYSEVWPKPQSRYHAQEWAKAMDAKVAKHATTVEKARASGLTYEALNAHEAWQRAIGGSVEAWTVLAKRTLETASRVDQAPERGQQGPSATLDENDSENDVGSLGDDGKKDVETTDGIEILG